MQLIRILTAILLVASGAHAQTACSNVPGDVARQVSEMQTFENRVPAPSSTNTIDCLMAKNLKTGIDDYRSGLASHISDGCIGVYANTILAGGVFNPACTILGKFVAACVAAGH
ncbi:hypothetical protein DFH09DRAFT_1376296 [Mycena vulgaris]|nr:hypothetical protein DFH09DRAFT_1376296 [Mycena vulgaris]